MEDQADLTPFKQKPTPRILLGVFAIGFSYVIGWPAISALGALAVYWKEPLILGVGGPVMYGLSHLCFIAGMALAGAEFSVVFLRWAARAGVEKLLGQDGRGA